MKPYSRLLVLLFVVVFQPNVALAQWAINGVGVSTMVGSQFGVVAVSDGAGGAIAAWVDTRLGSYDVFVQRVSGAGVPQWTLHGVELCAATNAQLYLAITSDGVGGAIVTWQDSRHSPGNDDVYAQRVDALGVPQWTADGVAICTAPGHSWDPQIEIDGAGGAIIAWRDERNQNPDIFAQRVDAMGVPQWTANGVVLCDKPNTQINCAIVSDGIGGAIVAWQDYRGGASSDIYAQRLNAYGEIKWTPAGVGICTAVESQSFPTITTDGASGVIVAWEDNRSLISDIYAQRVNLFGDPQWMTDGVLISTGSAVDATIVSDAIGGAIISWRDHRGADYDIYAQRVNAAGSVQWTANGVVLCAAVRDQWRPAIVTDGAEGAVVTWHDERSSPSPSPGPGFKDIYAQRINSAGIPEWDAHGVALCAAADDQLAPKIVSDTAGGAIVAWSDVRDFPLTESDVYAQRILFYGGVPTSVGDMPSPTLSLSPNFPNPFSGETTIDLSSIVFDAVEVEVFDVAGRRVRVMNRVDAGSKQMTFDGRDDAGQLLPSGVYFYRVRTNGAEFSRKMVIAR